MVGAFAEFERAMIRERTSAGLAAARAEDVSAGGGRNSMPRNAARSPKAWSPVVNQGQIWRNSTMSASQRFPALSPNTSPTAHRRHPMNNRPFVFDDGHAYEETMVPWLRPVGETFVDWLDPPSGLKWIDVGCGTGVSIELLIQRCAPRAVEGIDHPSRN